MASTVQRGKLTTPDQGLLDRYRRPAVDGLATPDERAARARAAMTGLRAGVRITKSMYRPGA